MQNDVTTAIARPEASSKPARPQAPTITRMDNVLRDDQRKSIDDFLRGPGWRFGWKSKRNTDEFSFWHKHFAGPVHADRVSQPDHEEPVSCAEELARKTPAIHLLWAALEKTALKGHVLVRCYANGHTYGSDGTYAGFIFAAQFHHAHYPHSGGPVVRRTVSSTRRRPTSSLRFIPGPTGSSSSPALPRMSRGVSRICPILRITLMFKTELWNG